MSPDELTANALKQIEDINKKRALAVRRAQLTPDYTWPGASDWRMETSLGETAIQLGWLCDATTFRHRLRATRDYLANTLGYWEDEIVTVLPYSYYTLAIWRGLSRDKADINNQYAIEAWVCNEKVAEVGILKPSCRIEKQPKNTIVCELEEKHNAQ